MKEVRFLLFTLIYLLLAAILGIVALILKWIPFLKENMEEMLDRIRFIWKVVLNHYGLLSEKVAQQFSEVDFKGRMKSMKNGIRVNVDTDDTVLLLLLLWDALYLAWLVYLLVSFLVYSVIYATIQSDVTSTSKIEKEAPAYTTTYEPTPAKKQQFEVCPCLNQWEGNNGKLALLDPDNGEIVFSKSIASSSEGFSKRQNTEVSILSKDESNVVIKIGNYEFTIQVNQNFQVKSSPFFIYLIDEDGKVNVKQTQ